MIQILLVEDDLSLIDGLAYSLKKNGFAVEIARSVREALALFARQQFDLLVLDLGLPDGSGFDICRHVRQTSPVPIIFLTASDEEVNVVMGLDIGGDDYITKPFKLNELFSRINALLRRSSLTKSKQTVLRSNGIELDLLAGQAFQGGKPLELTASEFKLLRLFLENPNMVLTRDMILDRLWDQQGSFVDDNTLSVYIRRLRAKIEKEANAPRFLTTVRGLGYCWKDQKQEVADESI